MQRITITVDEDLAAQFDGFMERKGYENRSEAIRDLLREKLEQDRVERDRATHCVACLTYVYNHEERELAQRLTKVQHDHHDLALSTLHVHLDHDNCMEAVILRGGIGEVRGFANGVISQRGVRHGSLNLVPADVKIGEHNHTENSDQSVPHIHSHPNS
ncbi:MAG: nickel-responsive transcriptional regulator NikR [Rhodospirillales bacterium]|nr:nickel-responsive transcriptional regulator NikR [Rhodospirillales bacterium]